MEVNNAIVGNFDIFEILTARLNSACREMMGKFSYMRCRLHFSALVGNICLRKYMVEEKSHYTLRNEEFRPVSDVEPRIQTMGNYPWFELHSTQPKFDA